MPRCDWRPARNRSAAPPPTGTATTVSTVTYAPSSRAWGSWTAALAADDVFGWVHPDDADWFAPLAARHEQLVVVARALLRRFAAHLPGFGHAGAAYLAERVLPLGGSVRLDEDAVVVELPRPPLHVLLALAGLDAFTFRCRWLDVPVVVVHEAD